MKKTLKVVVLSLPGIGLWQEVLIQYNENNVPDVLNAEEIVKEFQAVGLTPVADIPATPLGNKSIFLSREGTGEYGTWTEHEFRRNAYAIEQAFNRLELPYIVLKEWQDRDMTRDLEGGTAAAYN